MYIVQKSIRISVNAFRTDSTELLETDAGPRRAPQAITEAGATPSVPGSKHSKPADSVALLPPLGFLFRFAESLHLGRRHSGARARPSGLGGPGARASPHPAAALGSRAPLAGGRPEALSLGEAGLAQDGLQNKSRLRLEDLAWTLCACVRTRACMCMHVYVSVRKSVGGSGESV